MSHLFTSASFKKRALVWYEHCTTPKAQNLSILLIIPAYYMEFGYYLELFLF